MFIQNVEAMKALIRSVIPMTSDDERVKSEALARQKLDEETREYLAGIHVNLQFHGGGGYSMGDIGRRRL